MLLFISTYGLPETHLRGSAFQRIDALKEKTDTLLFNSADEASKRSAASRLSQLADNHDDLVESARSILPFDAIPLMETSQHDDRHQQMLRSASLAAAVVAPTPVAPIVAPLPFNLTCIPSQYRRPLTPSLHPALLSARDYLLKNAHQPFPEWFRHHFGYNHSLALSRTASAPGPARAAIPLDLAQDCDPIRLASSATSPLLQQFCCDYRQGLSLIHHWDAIQAEKCPLSTRPPPTAPVAANWYHPRSHRMDATLGDTSVRCRLRPDQTRDPQGQRVPQNFCTIENVALNLSRLEQHLSQPPQPRVGHEIPQTPLFQTACQPRFLANQTGNGMDLWLLTALEGGLSTTARCLAVVDHTVLFMFRWHTMNVYHIHEEFIHTFVAEAMLDVPFPDFQIIHTDRRPQGLLFDLWQQVFSPDRPLLNLSKVWHDLAPLWQPQARSGNDLLCFRRAAFNVHSGVSLFSMEKDITTPCVRSPLVIGMSQMILDHLAIPRIEEPRPHYHDGSHTKRYQSYCRAAPFTEPRLQQLTEAIVSFLLNPSPRNWSYGLLADPPLNLSVVLRKPHLPRQIPHQDEFLALMRELPFLVQVTPLDFGDHPFRDQFIHGSQSEILFGVHGAGLTFALYQPSYGGVVEVLHETRARDFPYPSIANMRGLAYRPIELGHQSIPKILKPTIELILEVKRRKECFEMFYYQQQSIEKKKRENQYDQ